jgi:hypothetical protein
VRTLAAAAVAGASAAADSRLRRVAPHALAAAIDSAVAAARDDARHIAAAWHAARRGSPHAIASR